MRITLTYTGTPEKHENYVRWLKSGEPIEVVKISAADNNLNELNNCDALVLSGGVDIHPRFYGSKQIDYDNVPNFQEERDEFEIAAFQHATKNGLPVLGVCRGMQLVNCILGGTMNQDLAELNKVHKAVDLVDKVHGLSIVDNSLISEITGQTKGEINSAHHQSIKKVGEGLMVNCRADDGTIEGLEWSDKKNKSFLLCVQWHPERMYKYNMDGSPLSKNIRNRFIKEIEQSKKGK